MQIESGKLYKNRTFKYLFPTIKHYGEELTNYLRYFIKLGVGLDDENKKLPAGNFFILINTNPNIPNKKLYLEKLDRFLTWLKYKDFYVTDYVFCTKEHCESHMVVIDIPREYNNAYIKFMTGKYSQMYTKEQIFKLFPIVMNNPKRIIEVEKIRNVLFRGDESEFIKQVNKDFGTNISKFDKNAELDYPFIYKEEVFNFKG